MCRRLIALVLTIFSAVCLGTAEQSKASINSSATLIPRSNSEQIYTIVHVLSEFLNYSNPHDSLSLSQVFPSSTEFMSFLRLKDEVRELAMPYKSGSRLLSGLLVHLTIKNLTENDHSLNAECVAILQVDNVISHKTISLGFNKNSTAPLFTNSGAFADSLSQLLADCKMLIDKKPPTKERPTQSRALGGKSIQTNRQLVPKTFYQGHGYFVPRFTVNKSYEIFGNEIFGWPYDVSAIKTYNPIDGDYETFFITDPAWNRIIANDDLRDWMIEFGSYGSGLYDFWHPSGSAFVVPDAYLVADALNHRVLAYDVQLEPEIAYITFVDALYIDSGRIVDVASAYNPDDEFCPKQIASVDNKYSRIIVYDVSGHYYFTRRPSDLLTYGSGFCQVKKPTSVCYGRDPISNYNNSLLYVTDDGNNRVICVDTESPSHFMTTNFSFPDNAYLTSVDVDIYGYVYVVDRHNSIIYLFSPDLQTHLATYGSPGTGDHELYFPNRITMASGWSWNITDSFPLPMVMGEVFLAEQFTNETGIRRYSLGNEIIDHQVIFFPRTRPEGYDYLYCEWIQSGATESWRKVYHNGNLLQDEYEPLNVPGHHYELYLSADSLENGYYVFEIRAKSRFSPSIDTTFLDSVWVARSSCGYDSSNWVKSISGVYIEDMIQRGTDEFIALTNDSTDIILKSVDPCGNINWSHDISTFPYQYGYSIEMLPDKGFIIVGSASDGYWWPPKDIFVCRTDSLGSVIWVRRFGSSEFDAAYDITLFHNNDVLVTGESGTNTIVVRMNINGDSLWTSYLGEGRGKSIRLTNDGNFIVADPYLTDFEGMPSTATAIKIDSLGQPLWTKAFEGSFFDVTATSDGGYLFTGQKNLALWLLKLTSAGAQSWSKTVDLSIYDAGLRVLTDAHNKIIVSGFRAGVGGSEHDFLLTFCNRCGDTIWTKVFPDADTNSEAGVLLPMADGGYLIGGHASPYAYPSLRSKLVRIPVQPNELNFICGDVNANGVVNILDATYIISFLYKGGPPPVPYQSGDVNNSCMVTILDNSYLLAYLYHGGPPPVCPR